MKNEIISSPVVLTEGAVNEIKQIMQSSDLDKGLALRVGVKSGGCSGFSYIIGFDNQKENDELFVVDGVNVLVDKSHLVYLEGITIDFENGLNNRGFTFENPNAKESCGCGTSFSA